jgi:hypothetical protein
MILNFEPRYRHICHDIRVSRDGEPMRIRSVRYAAAPLPGEPFPAAELTAAPASWYQDDGYAVIPAAGVYSMQIQLSDGATFNLRDVVASEGD